MSKTNIVSKDPASNHPNHGSDASTSHPTSFPVSVPRPIGHQFQMAEMLISMLPPQNVDELTTIVRQLLSRISQVINTEIAVSTSSLTDIVASLPNLVIQHQDKKDLVLPVVREFLITNRDNLFRLLPPIQLVWPRIMHFLQAGDRQSLPGTVTNQPSGSTPASTSAKTATAPKDGFFEFDIDFDELFTSGLQGHLQGFLRRLIRHFISSYRENRGPHGARRGRRNRGGRRNGWRHPPHHGHGHGHGWGHPHPPPHVPHHGWGHPPHHGHGHGHGWGHPPPPPPHHGWGHPPHHGHGHGWGHPPAPPPHHGWGHPPHHGHGWGHPAPPPFHGPHHGWGHPAPPPHGPHHGWGQSYSQHPSCPYMPSSSSGCPCFGNQDQSQQCPIQCKGKYLCGGQCPHFKGKGYGESSNQYQSQQCPIQCKGKYMCGGQCPHGYSHGDSKPDTNQSQSRCPAYPSTAPPVNSKDSPVASTSQTTDSSSDSPSLGKCHFKVRKARGPGFQCHGKVFHRGRGRGRGRQGRGGCHSGTASGTASDSTHHPGHPATPEFLQNMFRQFSNWSPQSSTPGVSTEEPESNIIFDSKYVRDTNYFDGHEFSASIISNVDKGWVFRNSGPIEWPKGTRLVFISGDDLHRGTENASDPLTQAVAPGETHEFTIQLASPPLSGSFRAVYRLASPEGALFGDPVWFVFRAHVEGEESEDVLEPDA